MSHWLKMLGAGEDNLCGSSWTVTWPLFLLLGTAGADDALLFSAVSDAFRDARSRVDGETVDDYARLLRGVCDGLRGLLPNGVSDWALRRYAGDGYRAVECNVAEAIISLTFDRRDATRLLQARARGNAMDRNFVSHHTCGTNGPSTRGVFGSDTVLSLSPPYLP
ncbi:hypothetical protein DIPPA_28830 [Diplonema papillatum]|nr:hypothetical protein DIPPA_28830 [Diplonema papillatum]